MRNWTAWIAPLDVVGDDGRLIAGDGRWQVRAGGPLLSAGATVGSAHGLGVHAGWLVATGQVIAGDVADRMACGELLPQFELGEDASSEVVEVDGEIVTRFTGGTIVAISAGASPAFDGVRFEVEP